MGTSDSRSPSSLFFNLSSIVAHSYRGGDPDPLAPPRPYFTPDLSAALPRRLHGCCLRPLFCRRPCRILMSIRAPSIFRSTYPPHSPTVTACCGWWKPLASSFGSQRAWQGWCWNMLKLSIFAIRAARRPRAQLQRAGVRVMLDDCFSQGSVIFPARRLHFNAYKLDMSIVNDAQHDPKALALIKARPTTAS